MRWSTIVGSPTKILLLVALLVVDLLAMPHLVSAAPIIYVGFGTADSCNELALRVALADAAINGGATIRFQCGPAPVTIAVMPLEEWEVIESRSGLLVSPAAISPPDNTTIDGGGLVTLQGSFVGSTGMTLVRVKTGRKVVLKGLSLAGGSYGVFNEGTLTIAGNTIAENQSLLTGSGGVVNDGALTVTNTIFVRNGTFVSAAGGSISNSGRLTVNQSSFSSGNAYIAGGIYNSESGIAEVKNSLVSGNFGDWVAGGIYNLGALTIENSEFIGNAGVAIGAVFNGGFMYVKNSSFSRNSGICGAVCNDDDLLTVTGSRFFDNHAAGWGGGISSQGPLIVDKSTFTGNYADNNGGAIFAAGALIVSNSQITGNGAGISGGGIYVEGGFQPSLIRTLVQSNTPDNVMVAP